MTCRRDDETVKRLERTPGKVSAYTSTMEAIQKALEAAGVEFTNDDAPGSTVAATPVTAVLIEVVVG